MLPLRTPFALLRTTPCVLTSLVIAGIALVFPVVAAGSVFDSDHHAFEAEGGLGVALNQKISSVHE